LRKVAIFIDFSETSLITGENLYRNTLLGVEKYAGNFTEIQYRLEVMATKTRFSERKLFFSV